MSHNIHVHAVRLFFRCASVVVVHNKDLTHQACHYVVRSWTVLQRPDNPAPESLSPKLTGQASLELVLGFFLVGSVGILGAAVKQIFVSSPGCHTHEREF